MNLTIEELHSELSRTHEAWRKAILAGEYVWAAYYANDIEAVARRLTTITHNYVKDHYADPESALGRHPRTANPAKRGD